jgi:chitin synthase
VSYPFRSSSVSKRKISNSQRWFFNAFGPILNPTSVSSSMLVQWYHAWAHLDIPSLEAFDINSNVGGACDEIVALKGKYGVNLLNPLVTAQNFEYKMSNILDKPLESIFGYITVLPGAFSAYRYIAIQNEKSDEAGPLYKYFLGAKMHGSGGIFTTNMYLAEDRILCWELVSKRGCSWRRWLNGSFFAAVHSTFHFYYIYRSSHTLMRKFWIHVEMVYQFLNLIFSWYVCFLFCSSLSSFI